MGNAGSNNMHRERHKSTDLSTPNSPFRELPSGARECVTSQRGVDANVSSVGGANTGGSAQAFTFDKKLDTRSVLSGGSSQEDEEQPYYTKPVGSSVNNNTVLGGVIGSTIPGTTTSVASSEYGTPGHNRKRSSIASNGGNSAISQMSAKNSTEFNEVVSREEDVEQEEDETSIGEDISTKTENKNPAVPTMLRWDGGGRNVVISGTFSKWKPIPMVRSHGNFVTIIDLPMGDHQYKFCVDGEWKHDPKLKSIETEGGNRNNLVSVRQSDFEVFQALAKDSENVPNYAEKEYSQEVPQSKPWEKISGPPVLPPHLLQVILNKDTPLSCEPTLLPEPNHVMLNHLYALSIKDGVMVLSATHRYRKKYVTTLLYKPI